MFLNGEEFLKGKWIKRKLNIRQNYVLIVFRISPTNFKKPTISDRIFGFLKFVGEMQEPLPKRSQKSHKEVILHYISLPIYPLLFRKFCLIQKQQKSLRNYRFLVKTNLAVNLVAHKLLFSETLINFLEPTIKLITGIFDLQK